MNKHFLKNVRDNIPEWLKYAVAPIFRNKLVKHRLYIETRKKLKERENFDGILIKRHQFDKLKEILIYANKNVPYYWELFHRINFNPQEIMSFEDIKVIPFLTKDIIRKHFEELQSTVQVESGHYVATTGGSTGEPLKVLLDYDCVFKENAFVNFFRGKLGYTELDKLATFRGVEFGNKLWKFNPMQNELIFSPFRLSNKTLQKYLNKIRKYNPDYLNGYLSTIYFFAKLLYDNNLKLEIPIKGIFLISENIDNSQRDFIEEFFGVKSQTFFGHSERCIIAEEIEKNLYSFDPYYGFTELIENDDKSFSICGTGFLNKTMPLIRYKTDDVCTKEDNYYKINGGRKSTHGLWGKNGEFFSHAAFNFHSDIFKDVIGYQFVQKQKGYSDLLIVVNKSFKESEIENLYKEIDRKTKGIIEFDIKVTDKLILSKRGKFNMFISEIKE